VGNVRYEYRLLASATGYAITVAVAWFLLFNYQGWAGRDVDVWLQVGADVRAGVSPYDVAPWASRFYYAPPWALFFGAITWLGKPIVWALIMLAELLALRYIAGSWLRVGYFGLCFLTGAELVSGAFNLVIAAALVAAIRGDSRFAVVAAMAKLSPALAIRDARSVATVAVVAVLVTLPVLGWWVDWGEQLLAASGAIGSVGYGEIPWLARLALAIGILVVWRSPRAGALAAAVAIPGLYAISIVLLYAVIAPGAKPLPQAIRREPVTAPWPARASEAPIGT
jgi:hypothetical protein